MIDKRKNDDFSATRNSSPKTSSRPVSHCYNVDKRYQFYVDAAPSDCLAHLRTMDGLARADISYHITPLTAESGKTFKVLRTERYGRSSQQTTVTVHLDPYDLDNLRTFVTIYAVLMGPLLMIPMIILGVVGAVVFLIILSAISTAPAAAANLFTIMGLPIPFGLYLSYTFMSSRRTTLDLVANHLALLRK